MRQGSALIGLFLGPGGPGYESSFSSEGLHQTLEGVSVQRSGLTQNCTGEAAVEGDDYLGIRNLGSGCRHVVER